MQVSLTSALYLVGFIQNVYMLLVAPSQRGQPLLLVFLGAMALLTADYLVWENAWLSWSAQFWVNRFTHASLTYVLGPSLYLYFQLNAEPTYRLRGRHLWHGLPYALVLLLAIFVFPYCLPEWEVQTANWLLPADAWPQTLRGLHILLYVWLGGRLLWLQTSQERTDSFRRNLMVAILLTGGCSMLVATGAYWLPDASSWKPYWEVTAVVCSVGMLYLLNRLLTEPRPAWLSVSRATRPLHQDISTEPPVKYQNSALNETAAKTLFETLEVYITESRVYENPELTLSQLAETLQVSANRLSQAINQVGGQNFYELINHHRVVAACRLLTEPKFQHLSVSGIGYEVGFRSKSTYYAAFRREKGVTPNVYRKRVNTGKPLFPD